MKLSLFIARHYFFSKKSTNVINLISLISVVGIAIGTMALIVILSIFNGLEELIISRYDSFDPDFRIEAVSGKTFRVDSNLFRQVLAVEGVKYVVPVVEENALVKYGDKYFPAHLMGVTDDFVKLSGMDSMITAGQFLLNDDSVPTAVIGQSIAGILGLQLEAFKPLHIYVPRRLKKVTMNPDEAFKQQLVVPVGTFSVEPEIDEHILLPIKFVSHLLDYKNQITGLEIDVSEDITERNVREDLTKIFGDKVVIKNRFEQHQFLYKIMRTEKVIVFLILALILLIASFNVIGSLSMLIIEKRKDIKT
ncbi:MAG: ABC transporter permease, partial [Candidatus Zixiibacteriota bacterium]